MSRERWLSVTTVQIIEEHAAGSKHNNILYL
jgi:hypothetical protein